MATPAISIMFRCPAFAAGPPLPLRLSPTPDTTCKRRRTTPWRSATTAVFTTSGRAIIPDEDGDDWDEGDDEWGPPREELDVDTTPGPSPDDEPLNMPPPPDRLPPLFVDDEQRGYWKAVDVGETFAPIRPDEEALLREKVPERIANFLLARADDAVRLRTPRSGSDNSFMGQLLSDLPPDVPDWDAPLNAEYRDYVYVTTTGPPSFRRKGSSLFGGGDGLPDPDRDGFVGNPFVDSAGEPEIKPGRDPTVKSRADPRLMSLFIGQVDSIDEQAGRTGYAILAMVSLWFLLKLFFGIISFFLSFTFSFFAIFALSAGIFVLFFFLRF